jgi:exopolysaccharide biosynthesis polyprenyl glycosylphosphotransferase
MSVLDDTTVEIQEGRPAGKAVLADRGEAVTLPRGRVRILVGADLLALALAMALTYLVSEWAAPRAIVGPANAAAPLIVAMWLGWVGIFTAYKLYERETRTIATASFDEVGALFHAVLTGNLLYLLVAQVIARTTDVRVYSAVESVLFLVLVLALVPGMRGVARSWLRPSVVRPRRTLVVGAGEEGRRVQRKIQSHPEYGLEFVGFVDDVGPSADRGVLGRPEDLTTIVDDHAVDWVIVASSRSPHERMLAAIREVRRPDVHLSIVPTFSELFASNAMMDDLEGMPLVSLPTMRLSRATRTLKRTVDVVGAGAGLLVLSPLLAVIALVVKLDSPGPVLFRQQRRGRDGATFEIVKFRTMRQDAESERFALATHNELAGPLFKIKSDPRITRPGRLLRRWSLDELPQLWNVVTGDMSLVGPRPFVIHEANQITGWAARRLDLTPGITGLWQVCGRNDLPFEEMVKLDYVYVTNWSLWWDLKILCQTIPVVLARKGAY